VNPYIVKGSKDGAIVTLGRENLAAALRTVDALLGLGWSVEVKVKGGRS
jgi:hypothetical protein